MSYTFTGSIPTKDQIEKLRLILSTYQDGMGQLVFEPEKSLPGWRDFERAVALAFDGTAQESKAIFDVLVPISQNSEINYGISCIMRQTLRTVERTGRVTVEVSNSAGKFWDGLRARGIDDYDSNPVKYYPFADNAIWSSEIFKLEPLPESDLGYGLKRRVIEYFPGLWKKANEK